MLYLFQERREVELKKKNKVEKPFNAERCAESIIKVLKKHNANYFDVEKVFAVARNKIFSEPITHEMDSGKYDGEIRIKTRIDNSAIDKTMKKLKKASSLADELAKKKRSI